MQSWIHRGFGHRQRLVVGFVAALVVATALSAVPYIARPASAGGTWTVDSLADFGDSSPGDTTCEDTGPSGFCTLRAAIQESNASPGPDTIVFSVAGTINIGSALPVFSDITIDGTTAPGANCAQWPPVPTVEVKTNAVGFVAFDLGNGSSTVRGLVINGGPVRISTVTTGNKLECNFIGTDITGTTTTAFSGPPGQPGQVILQQSSGNTIGGPSSTQRNLISGESQAQFFLNSVGNVSAGDVIENNYIGTDKLGGAITRSGSVNRQTGISVIFASNNVIRNNRISAVSTGIDVAACRVAICGADRIAAGNQLRANVISSVTEAGIDLRSGSEALGVTLNHSVNPDPFAGVPTPNGYQNFPVLDSVTSTLSPSPQTRIVGRLDGRPNRSYDIEVFANSACQPASLSNPNNPQGFGPGETLLGTFTVLADGNGSARFDQTLPAGLGEPFGVTTTATDLVTNDTSEYSYCYAASSPNTTWVTAQPVGAQSTTAQRITSLGQEKWFKFPVSPGANVSIKLKGASGSAVSLHNDPNPIYNGLNNPQSSAVLSAEAADTGFLPSGFLPSGSLPSGFLPSGFLPSGSLPSGFLPSGFLPSGSLPSGSLPSGFLPSGFLPSGFLPSGFLPSGSLPSGFLPTDFLPSGSLPSGTLPSGFLPGAALPSGFLEAPYSSAARKSLVGLSADPAALVQSVTRNVYDTFGDMYVRVVGPSDPTTPFDLEVNVTGGVCGSLSPISGPLPTASGSGLQTLILTDQTRLSGTSTEISAALAKLDLFKTRSDVAGAVVDFGLNTYARVTAARNQAVARPECPTAKNLLATEIKNVVDAFRATNPNLKYIVIAGGADVIPFFQQSDAAGLANEKDYVPPVAPNTASEAGLRSGLVSGQDYYGSSSTINVGGRSVIVPDLAVGRLVDSAADVTTALDQYINANGVVSPQSSLITGYDFVGDAAESVREQVAAATGSTPETLIQPPGEAPNGPNSWTAGQLRTKLFAGNHDVVMLTGHFSAGDLLAADYATTLSASEVAGSTADLTKAIVFALGCHGGYSIAGRDLLVGSSPDPDWAKAFLRKGAAGFVAATGYAYGDTELTEYGERLIVEFAKVLRTGTGVVTLGDALVSAKRTYMASVPQLSGIDEKTLTGMVLYGLPMMKVNMPGTRLPAANPASIATGFAPVSSGPGSAVQLSQATVTVNPAVSTPKTVPLSNLSTGGSVNATYRTGRDGVVANPGEPIFPKQIDNVSVAGQVLRGVALRGGTYADTTGITPLSSSPNTETSGVHVSFNSDTFYPSQPSSANFYDAVNGGSTTRLITVPAQYRSTSPGSTSGTSRLFSTVNMSLFYIPVSWTSNAALRAAGVSPAPEIFGASASANGSTVTFRLNVQNGGSAGVQSVWVLYTGEPGSPYHGTWAPVDLAQDPDTPTIWTGTLTIGANNPAAIRFIAQAVNGAGLTSLATNNGAFYSVAATTTPPPAPIASTVTLTSPTSATYQQPITLSASVTPAVANRTVVFSLGDQSAIASTGSTGIASVVLTPVLTPGSYGVQATVRANATYSGAGSQSQSIEVAKAPTTLDLSPSTVNPPNGQASGLTATLKSNGRGLANKSVVFSITGTGGPVLVRSVTTDAWGAAPLGVVTLPGGTYSVTANFGGLVPVVGGGSLETIDPNYVASQSTAASLTITSTLAPTITASATNADNSTYASGSWTKQNVVVRFTCTDPPGGSGIASCTPDQTISAEGATTVTGTVTANNGRTATTTFDVRIDRTGPIITLTTPTAGASYPVGTAVNAAYSCADAASGLGTCSGSVPTGSAIDTATAGPKSFTVNAADALGNLTTRTVSYTVTSLATGPVVRADFGVSGLQEIGFPTTAVALTGSFSDPGGSGPYTASVRWAPGQAFSSFVLNNNSAFATARVYPSAGVQTVTVRICNGAGVCGTDDVVVRTKVSLTLTPVLNCVVDRGSTVSPRYAARFGYANTSAYAVMAVTLPLIDNTFTTLPVLRGQPQIFLAGTQTNVFTVGFSSGSVTWRLNGRLATASTSSPRC